MFCGPCLQFDWSVTINNTLTKYSYKKKGLYYAMYMIALNLTGYEKTALEGGNNRFSLQLCETPD